MSVDDFFSVNESGRSPGILAEDLSERPEIRSFESFEYWKQYYITTLRYPMMVSFLMPNNTQVRHLIDTIEQLRKLTDNIYESYCLRYSYEYGLYCPSDRSGNTATYLCRFVDMGNDIMNYVKFVFWMTYFFYRQNIHNKELVNRTPFDNFTILFSTKEHDFYTSARVKYSNEILPNYVFESCLLRSLMEDIFKNQYLKDSGFREINRERLTRFVDRMRMRFGLSLDSYINAVYAMIRKHK